MKHSPLEQFTVSPLLGISVGKLDLSFTNASLVMLLSIAACIIYIALALRRAKIVPSKLQASVELVHSVVSSMTGATMDRASAKKFMPLIFSIFLFTLFCNLVGVIPGFFAPTGQIIITLALATVVFATMLILGFSRHGVGFFKILLPSGCPIWLAPIIVVVELFSFLAKPISLSLRLAANVVSGHVLLHVLAGSTLSLFLLAKPFSFALIIVLVGAEICIAILQAYIFAVLSCVYLGEIINLH